MIGHWIKNLLLSVSLILFLLVSLSSGEAESGRISGKILVDDPDAVKEGVVYLYNSRTGPVPEPDRYWRIPDWMERIHDGGELNTEPPAGDYYIEIILRTSSTRPGHVREGDYYYLIRNKDGSPKMHTLKSGESIDLGVISSLVLFGQVSNDSVMGISGMVIDDTGEPVDGVMLLAEPENSVSGGFSSDSTGMDGRYLLRVNEEGSYRIRVRDLRGDRPPVHGILIENHQSDYVSVENKITKGVDIKVIRTSLSEGR